MADKVFNPLDKLNLAKSVAEALLEKPVSPMPPDYEFEGAGVYAIYYVGAFEPYSLLAKANGGGKFKAPIYVGKAVPAGTRKGGFGLGEEPGTVLFSRLAEHAESISEASNLSTTDFRCRFLVCEDIWIPLGESLLIETFSPLWNKRLDGFGNHDPGKGRYNQKNSPWDVLHPGREWATRLAPHPKSQSEIANEVKEFLKQTLQSVPSLIKQAG